MTTMRQSAARHLAAGVEDLDELARLVQLDANETPSKRALASYRAYFRRHGENWIDAVRERNIASTRRRRSANPEVHREATRRWLAEHPVKKALLNCQRSARVRGQECSITLEDVEALFAPMVCSVTGLSLTWDHDGSSARRPWAPSIDRIDCSLGYVPGNVRAVCWAFNQMRGDFPDEVVFALAKALAARAP